MKILKNIISCGVAGAIIMVCLVVAAKALPAAETGLNKKILLLNSYHAGYKGSDDTLLGFKEVMRTSLPDAEIDIEYLDSKHFSGPEFDARVMDTLTFKYRDRPYDLIVSTDDYAFNVVERSRDQLFGKTPVVFCGTNNFDKKRIKERPDFVGVNESPSFAETLELMFKLHPATKEVIVIHDDSVTGQLNSADFREAASRFEPRAKFSYWNGKKLEEMLDEAGKLKPGKLVVYFASYVQDAGGKRHSSVEALKMISNASKVPIYGGWAFNLGHGIVGGRLVNLYEHGKSAALLAVKLLRGESRTSLAALQPSPNKFMFDYNELERFSISAAGLPTGSEIINRPRTLFSQYGTTLLLLLSAVLLLLLAIIFAKLLASNKHLKQSRIKYSSMVGAFDGLMYVCSPGYRVEFMNEQMIKRTGYDATGELCYKALHGLDSICSWCRNDRVFAGENVQWEIRSPMDERWYNVSNTPLQNADGTVSKQAMITDITERKDAEEKLLKSEERYRSLFSYATDGIFIISPDGKLLEVNGSFARMHGYSVEEMLRMSLRDLDTPETLQAAPGRMQQILSGNAITFEVEHFHKDGHVFPLEVSACLIDSGGETSVLCFHRDISERKRLEKEKLAFGLQLQQTQRLESLGVLAGGIAHDFNNILAIIVGHCYFVKLDGETVDTHIPEIEKAAERAAGLCRQMLAYAGKAQFVQDDVNIEAQVAEAISMLKTTLPENAAIKFNCTDTVPFIKADAGQISQVAMNLIVNAAEAIGDAQGEIRVSLSKTAIEAGPPEKDYLGKIIPPGQYACLEVADNGGGMSQETYARVFEPFYTTKFAGRGLGMSAALGIITAHGGTVQLFSQSGQGALFKVYFPVQAGDSGFEESLQQAAR